MKHAGTHFEQVPKKTVEKIIAEQNSLPEKDCWADDATKAKRGRGCKPEVGPSQDLNISKSNAWRNRLRQATQRNKERA
jgi:hypothetical protein